MAVSWWQGTINSASNGSEIVTKMAQMLLAAGWTNTTGTTYERTYAGKTMTVNLFSAAFATTAYHTVILNGISCILYTGATTLVNAPFYVEISVSDDLFFVTIRGPKSVETGTEDLTRGSPRSFALVTSITPYLDADTVVDDQQCVVASHYSASRNTMSAKVYMKKGLNGVANVTGELATVRPAVQDISAVGDQLANNTVANNIMYSPYVVIEDGQGWRGRLNNVYFGGENYALAGDSGASYKALQVRVDGLKYMTTCPYYLPNATPSNTCYSPLGNPTPDVTQSSGDGVGQFDGGPVIIVKRGNGTE
jgi:hypothetical protein